MQRPRNAYFDPSRHLHPAMPTLIPLLTNSSISKFKPRARWIGNRFLQFLTDQEEIMVLRPLVADQVCRCSSVQDHHTLRLERRKLPPHFNGGGEGLFLRAGRPGGGRLRWTSNLNGGLHSNRGVGFIRLFARPEAEKEHNFADSPFVDIGEHNDFRCSTCNAGSFDPCVYQ